ncbi:MAG: RidA family protein [Spirochaetota bacterium]
MQTKKFSTGSTFEEEISYSRAVLKNNILYVSGTTGYNYKNMEISDDVVVQAEQCFVNIQEVWKNFDATFLHIVRINYIFPVREDFKKCWLVFRKYLGEVRPAATMIVAGLADPKMKLEVEVTADLT